MVDRIFLREFCVLVTILALVPEFTSATEQKTEQKSELNIGSDTNKTTPKPEDGAEKHKPPKIKGPNNPTLAGCTADPQLEQLYRANRLDMPADPNKVHISADRSFGTKEHMTLDGKVIVKGDGKTINSDQLIFDKNNNKVTATGNVIFTDSGIVLSADKGTKQIEGDQAQLDKSKFWVESGNARGTAKTINVRSKTKIDLTQSTYSTCREEKKIWELKAKRLKLDKAVGKGNAKHVQLKVLSVPVLYLPSISFPLDNRRKSGFLAPSFGASDTSGSDIKIPYYWNIAPNYDATFTPRFLGKRGGMLMSEFRYLEPDHKGAINLELLPDDNTYGEDRYLFSLTHTRKLSTNWSADINYKTVSDPNYIVDLGSGLNEISTAQLEQRIDFNYRQPQWSLLTRVQNFHPLLNVAEAYQRLPQILLTGNIAHPTSHRLNYHLHSEIVQFSHADNVPTGQRVDVMPGISYRLLDHPGYYIQPKLSVRYTGYHLDNQGSLPQDPSRTLPIISIDSGMFFDRDFVIGKTGMVQTLEPRLYYLYVPFVDQSNFPLFDTSRLTFDINQLFRENRYGGADRHGDANQVTLALTSRFQKQDSGFETFKATIGQIYYFNDRRVTLLDELQELSKNSDTVAEVNWNITPKHRVSAGAQWDPSRTDTKVSIFEYRYTHDKRRLLNLSYRFRDNIIEQTDMAGVWGLSKRWTAIGRWNYSIRDETTLEGFAGLEYNNCCWAIRLLGRSYIRDISAEKENSLQVQFVFKGLTTIGNEISDVYKKSIEGYADPFN